METTSNNNGSRIWSGRIQLIAIILIFSSPLLISAIWKASLDDWDSEKTINNGQLIDPAQPVIEAAKASGIDEALIRGHWTLLYSVEGDCLDQCRNDLWNMRQARMAQARQMHRVKGLLLHRAPLSEDTLAHFAEEHEGLQLAEVVETAGLWSQLERGTVYVIDPLGNLMMVYPEGAMAKKILDDLKRLLRVSRVG